MNNLLNQAAQDSTPQPAPVANRAEAEQLISHLLDVMQALLGIVQEETDLVRAGRLSEVKRLEPTKANLAGLYLRDIAQLKLSTGFIGRELPDALATLHRRHDNFHALLQINLTVLATAHAVSEGILRGVADELARKTSPQIYGALGKATAPSPKMTQPLALSRTL